MKPIEASIADSHTYITNSTSLSCSTKVAVNLKKSATLKFHVAEGLETQGDCSCQLLCLYQQLDNCTTTFFKQCGYHIDFLNV